MNEAIKLQHEAYELAIQKGGYNPDHERYKFFETIILDPLFWQALGKALGWDIAVCEHCGKCWRRKEKCAIYQEFGGVLEPWLYHALRYYELNLTGGDTEKFWKKFLI